MNEIAVFLKDQERLCPFYECNGFTVFTKEDDLWTVDRMEAFDPIAPTSVAAIRESTKELLPLLDECRIIAADGLTGIPFSVFDKAGFCIFSVSEISDAMLDGIISDIEQSDEQQRMREEMIRNACPAETDTPGVYLLDLVALQTECPEVSSKKAMRDFLESTPFLELHLLCGHIPPWLENDERYKIRTEQANGSIHAVITLA